MQALPIRETWQPAFGSLRPFAWVFFLRPGLDGKGAPGQATALRLGGRRCAPTALRPGPEARALARHKQSSGLLVSVLRASVSWRRRKTRCVRCAHSTQTVATSQTTIRAAREATSPVLLGASEALRALSGRAFAGRLVFPSTRKKAGSARQAVPGGGDFCGGEERRPSVGARSALRKLTRRSCLSVESAANAASSAPRLKAEHHSAVGAKRRPPQHESPPGIACRATPKPRESGRPQTTATGQDPPSKSIADSESSFQTVRAESRAIEPSAISVAPTTTM